MKDELIYCSDLEQLKQELKDNGMVDSEGNYTHGNTMSPIKTNDSGASLYLVRDNKLDMSLFPSLTSLGSYEEMFSDETKHNLYKSVYPYDVPVEYTDENGDIQTYMRPQKFAEFSPIPREYKKKKVREAIREFKDIEDDLTDLKKVVQFMARGFAGIWATTPQEMKDANPYKDNFDLFTQSILNTQMRLDLEVDQTAKIAKILNDEKFIAQILVDTGYTPEVV